MALDEKQLAELRKLVSQIQEADDAVTKATEAVNAARSAQDDASNARIELSTRIQKISNGETAVIMLDKGRAAIVGRGNIDVIENVI